MITINILGSYENLDLVFLMLMQLVCIELEFPDNRDASNAKRKKLLICNKNIFQSKKKHGFGFHKNMRNQREI